MSEVVVDEADPARERRARALRALRLSGRRLVWRGADWGVVMGADRRRRPLARLDESDVIHLVAAGEITKIADREYVLPCFCDPAPPLEPWVYLVAGEPRTRAAGIGFVGLALKAKEGRGPLSLRQAQAGLRLVRDAELQASDARLTMDWNAVPAGHRRRGPTRSGFLPAAASAARSIGRVRRSISAEAFELAWLLCVKGATLRTVRDRFALTYRGVQSAVAAALEALAEAYDHGR